MIWIKRLAPLVVLALGWVGWTYWHDWAAEKREREAERLALATAQVWVASARFYDDPERYQLYRDSLLAADSIEGEELLGYAERFEPRPEQLLPFATKVKQLVDSLCKIDDSLAAEAAAAQSDSSGPDGDTSVN